MRCVTKSRDLNQGAVVICCQQWDSMSICTHSSLHLKKDTTNICTNITSTNIYNNGTQRSSWLVFPMSIQKNKARALGQNNSEKPRMTPPSSRQQTSFWKLFTIVSLMGLFGLLVWCPLENSIKICRVRYSRQQHLWHPTVQTCCTSSFVCTYSAVEMSGSFA